MEQLFERIQKPYVEHLKKIEKAKRNYYRSCKEAKTVMNQVRYALTENVKLIPPQVNKIHTSYLLEQPIILEIIARTQLGCMCDSLPRFFLSAQARRMQVFMEEADYKIYRRRLKYQDAVNEMLRYHPTYIRNMTSAFLKCQEMEKVKLQFYTAFLHSLQRTLDLSQNPKYVSLSVDSQCSSQVNCILLFTFSLAPIYDELHHVIEQIDYEKDLKMWSSNYGIVTSAPQFVVCLHPFITLWFHVWKHSI